MLSGGLTLAGRKRGKSSGDATRKLAIELARLAADDRGQDVVVLNLRGRSPVTDYFIIASGSSDRQRRAVADDAVELAQANGQPILGISGMEQPDWILIDMVDILVHVFEPQTRRYYDLEMLWGDAPKVRWKRPRAALRDDTPTAEREAP